MNPEEMAQELKSCVEKIHNNLFGSISPVETYISVESLVGSTKQLNQRINQILDLYAQIETDEQKLIVKPALKYCQALLEEMSLLLRYEENQLTTNNERVQELEHLLLTWEEQMDTTFRFLAEREMRVFRDEEFKKRLSEHLSRLL